MKIGVTSAALEYAVTVTALSVPMVVLGLEFAKLIDAVFGGLLSRISVVALGI